jgi:hypothetical protein
MRKPTKEYMVDCVMLEKEKVTEGVVEGKARNKSAVKEAPHICWLCNANCGSKTALLAHLNAHKMAIELQMI